MGYVYHRQNLTKMKFSRFTVLHCDHDVPRGLIRAGLIKIESEGREGQHVIEFNRVIGFNELVEVTDDDEFYEARRGDRPYLSRFVRNRLPAPCTKLAIVWRRDCDEVIRVTTAYFTNRDKAECPDEPGNIIRKKAKGIRYSVAQIEEALEFWSKHAFVEPIPRRFL